MFVEQAKKVHPRYLTMIIPARWFMGGRGLDSFRASMLHDDRIRQIHDFPNASDCFPGVEIKGGVCYFLWNRDNKGLCEVHSHDGENEFVTERPLLEEGMDTFIRNDNQISVLHKVRSRKERTFATWLNAGRYYGFHTKVEWKEKGSYGRIQTADGKDFIPMTAHKTDNSNTKVYIHGGECWLPESLVPKSREAIREYKILLPRSGNPGGSIIGKPKLGEPYTCSSNTYVVAMPPEGGLTEQQAKNVMSYIKTKFFRYLVAIKTATQDMAPRAYEFVPLQDFNKKWTDADLYERYGLSKSEIAAIEETIPEME